MHLNGSTFVPSVATLIAIPTQATLVELRGISMIDVYAVP